MQNVVQGFARGVARLWSRGCLGKGAVIVGALFILGMCRAILGGAPPATAPGTPPTQGSAQLVAMATEPPVLTAPPPPTASPGVATKPDGPVETPPTAAPANAPTDTQTVATVPTLSPTDTPTPAPASSVRPTMTPIQQAAPTAPDVQPATDPAGVPPLDKNNCPPDYPVKGNIGNNGKIYHVPGSRSYKVTDPERCFATAADAEAAGFRAPNT
jgi:hypothetical protein